MRRCLLRARGALEVAPTAPRPPHRVARPSPGFAASDVRTRRSQSSACLQGIDLLHTRPACIVPRSTKHDACFTAPVRTHPRNKCPTTDVATTSTLDARRHRTVVSRAFPHHLTYSAPPSTSSPSIVPPQLRPLPCIACFPIVPCVHPSLARTVLCVAYILVRACTSPTAELLWRFLCTCFSPVLLRAFLHTSVMLHVRTRATVLVCSQVSVLPRTTHPLPPTGPRIMDDLPTARARSLLRHRSRQTLLYIAAALIP